MNDFSNPAGRQPLNGCLVVLLIVIGLGVLTLWFMGGSGVGKKLPVLELTPLTGSGQPVTLDELQGKVVLVNFFATWCPPCRAELPHLDDLRKEFASNSDFVLLAVSSGGDDFEQLYGETQRLMQQLDLNMPTYSDPSGTTRGAFRDVAGWQGFPTSFVMDRQGIIREIWFGYGPGVEDEMQEIIQRLLSESNP